MGTLRIRKQPFLVYLSTPEKIASSGFALLAMTVFLVSGCSIFGTSEKPVKASPYLPIPGVLDEVGEELAGPADAALEKRKPQLREASRDAAEEDRLGDGVAGGREMTDVVVDEVRRRHPQPLIAA